MELRHLRFFVAVAEEGSLTVAAERRLHTAQPSVMRAVPCEGELLMLFSFVMGMSTRLADSSWSETAAIWIRMAARGL